jgi:SulP family sulfate permease
MTTSTDAPLAGLAPAHQPLTFSRPTGAARWLPILTWLPAYTRAQFSNDALAALIVTIMLIPQSLAYAMLAGLPPEMGLYASILPLAAYAIFGTSRTLAVGPVAVVSLMTAASVGELATQGTADYIALAIALALLSGGILVLLGIFRLGFIANFLSHSVIAGFITASAVLIAAGQLKHVLAIPIKGDTLGEMVSSLVSQPFAVNGPTVAIGASVLLFLFWVRKRLKPFLVRLGLAARPADMIAKAGPVVAVVATAAITSVWQLDAAGVRIVGAIPQGLPPLTLPNFGEVPWSQLFVPALIISLVGFVESISVAQTLAAKRRQRIVPNQELIGLGASNIAASMTGGYPVTGGFARSVVNFDAGAETPLAGALTAIGILAATLMLTPYLYFLPQATLAATIIVAVLSLVDIGIIKRTFVYSKSDFAAMLATILVTLFVGIEPGIVSGIILSLILHIHRSSRPHVAVVGQVPGTEHFRNVKRHQVLTDERLLNLRIDESLTFMNARYLEDTVYEAVADNPKLKHVVLMCSAINHIDASALESLEAINHRLRDAGVTLHLSEVKGPVMDRLKLAHFLDDLSGDVYLSQNDAFLALTTRNP